CPASEPDGQPGGRRGLGKGGRGLGIAEHISRIFSARISARMTVGAATGVGGGLDIQQGIGSAWGAYVSGGEWVLAAKAQNVTGMIVQRVDKVVAFQVYNPALFAKKEDDYYKETGHLVPFPRPGDKLTPLDRPEIRTLTRVTESYYEAWTVKNGVITPAGKQVAWGTQLNKDLRADGIPLVVDLSPFGPGGQLAKRPTGLEDLEEQNGNDWFVQVAPAPVLWKEGEKKAEKSASRGYIKLSGQAVFLEKVTEQQLRDLGFKVGGAGSAGILLSVEATDLNKAEFTKLLQKTAPDGKKYNDVKDRPDSMTRYLTICWDAAAPAGHGFILSQSPALYQKFFPLRTMDWSQGNTPFWER